MNHDRTKVVYLAGPMRGYAQWNFPAFDLNRDYLVEHGFTVISPADLDRNVGFDSLDSSSVFTESDFQDAMRRDYAALLRCDSIAFLNGWEKSRGANLERQFAEKLGLIKYRVDAESDYLEREVIVGVAGVARSGKDTLANRLVARLGFERRAFADTLRNVLYATNPIVETASAGPRRVQEIVDDIGWDDAKVRYSEIRELLQRLGTEGGRVHIAEDVWNRAIFEKPHGPRLVIPDVRFPNEADAIHARGGIVVRVTRDGYEPINGHVSETAYSDQDFIVENNGNIEDLYYTFLQGWHTMEELAL